MLRIVMECGAADGGGLQLETTEVNAEASPSATSAGTSVMCVASPSTEA